MAAEMFYLKYIFARFATTEEVSIATNYLLTMQFVLQRKMQYAATSCDVRTNKYAERQPIQFRVQQSHERYYFNSA